MEFLATNKELTKEEKYFLTKAQDVQKMTEAVDQILDLAAWAIYKDKNADGEEYNIDGKSVLVIGGAYSVDKEYRLMYGYKWFKDEQLTKEEMDTIYNKVRGKHFDIVLTHTCPYKYEPIEVFLSGINQSKVDKSMEHFLDKIEDSIEYDKWYCGHYHIDKKIDRIKIFM